MSYDLKIFLKKDSDISKDDIYTYLDEFHFMQKRSEIQWMYDNEQTQVYCLFEKEENEDDFEDFYSVDISCSINLMRPDFFGTECFKFIDDFVEKFDLYILDLQKDNIPKKYTRGVLEVQWKEENLKIIKAHYTKANVSYFEIEKSSYTWKYNYNKLSLQDDLGYKYFVPTIFYLKEHATCNISTLVVWTENIPFLLPKVDYICVLKKIKKLFGTKEEDGLIKYDDLMDEMGNYFESKDNYLIIHPESTENTLKQFNKLKLQDLEKIGKGVSADCFVNFKN